MKTWNQQKAVTKISAVMKRLSQVWPVDLEPNEQWYPSINGACGDKDGERLDKTLSRWEAAERERAMRHMERKEAA